MYDTILYPTDGSDSARAALTNVRDLSATYDAAVHVLHVVDTTYAARGIGDNPNRESSPGMVGDPEGAATPMGGDRDASKEARAKATAYGRELVRDVARRLDGSDTYVTVRGGDPSQVIPDYAEEYDVDIVVMGTRGKSGVERYVVRSVTESVLRSADVPVLAIPDPDELVTTDWDG